MNSERIIAKAHEVEADWTVHSDYSRLVEEELNEYSNIEVTEKLTEGVNRRWNVTPDRRAILALTQFWCRELWIVGQGYKESSVKNRGDGTD